MATSADNTVFDAAARIMVIVVLVTTLPALLGWWIRRQLPSYQLRALQTTLDDIDALYYCCVESGLMNDDTAVYARDQLLRLHARADAFRLRSAQAITLFDDFMHMVHGLSVDISEVHHEVVALRITLSKISLDGT